MTIRTRLAVIYGLAIIVTTVIVGAILWWQLGAALRGGLDQTLETKASAVLAGVENQGQSGLQEGDGPASGEIFVVIFDANGQRVDASAGVPADLTVPAPGTVNRTVTLGKATYAIHVVTGDTGARVVAGSNLATLEATQNRVAQSLLLVGAGAAFASLVGGWWLAGRALRPVALITEQAARIGATDLDRRLPVSRRHDELQVLASTLNGMLDRVSEAIRRQRIFVAAASHDLRTPIAAIQAELELAADERTTDEERRAGVQAAHADAIRLGELASALLDLAAVDGDGRALVRAPVRADQLVASVARRLEPLARERGMRIVQTAPDRVVRVDRIRLEQALTNLVVNAITYGPPGSTVEVIVEVETDAAGDPGAPGTILSIDVLDRGPGVAGEIAERLFQPFHRGPNAAGKGSGLGLATAAAAIRTHQGTIGVKRRDGGGSRFWLRVPA